MSPRLLVLASISVLAGSVLAAACGDAGPGAPDGGSADGSIEGHPDLGGGDGAMSGGDLAMDGPTRLRVHYPVGARAITVRGDAAPLDWATGVSMTDLGGDTYEYVLTLPAGVGQLEWKPLVDGTWSRGPNYLARRGETVDVYPHFFAAQGAVSQLFAAFHSNGLGNDRVIWVYLPASYGENTAARYPVLYMHDGQNLFTPSAPWGGWHVGDALDAAGEDGSIRDLIVIGVENAGGKRLWEYTPSFDASEGDGGGGDAYLAFLVDELKPQVDATLRTQPGRATTGVLGSSLGGLISAYAGVKKAGTFGLVGAMSPSTWWDELMIVDAVKGMTTPRPDKVYVDYGDGDDGGEDTIFLVQGYQSIGYADGTTFKNVIQAGGQHSENYWAQRLPGALAFLYGKR